MRRFLGIIFINMLTISAARSEKASKKNEKSRKGASFQVIFTDAAKITLPCKRGHFQASPRNARILGHLQEERPLATQKHKRVPPSNLKLLVPDKTEVIGPR